jgi:hypothetical protein
MAHCTFLSGSPRFIEHAWDVIYAMHDSMVAAPKREGICPITWNSWPTKGSSERESDSTTRNILTDWFFNTFYCSYLSIFVNIITRVAIGFY